jgi:prolipoprotein diacylglyceryltransferase
MQGAEPIYTDPSHPTQIYEALVYLVVFAITLYLYWGTSARNRKGLITGVGILIIFLFRFFVEYIKNVQVDAEIALRDNTGLILGQWLSIPFILWGLWLIWVALRRPAVVADTPKESEMAKPKPTSKKR